MVKINGDDTPSGDFLWKILEPQIPCYSILPCLGFVNGEVGKNTISTQLVLDQDPFPFLLNHEDRPKSAGISDSFSGAC